MRRFTLLALTTSVLAFVACSSGEETPSGQPLADAGADTSGGADAADGDTAANTDTAPDTVPDGGASDAAPDTLPTGDAPADSADSAPPPRPTGWDKKLGLPGLAGPQASDVAAIVVTSNRWVYVGGEFEWAGDVAAKNVAVWNGAKWLAVGSGLPGHVDALAKTATDEVYAAVAKGSGHSLYHWDKTKWTDLGGDTDSQVQSIDVAADGTVYVAGHFTTVGTAPITGLAKYKAGAWSAVAGAKAEPFEAVRVTATGLCVAGSAEPGSVGVACLDGTKWTDMHANLERGEVKSIALDAAGVPVIGGQFWNSSEHEVPGSIARWNATDSKWELVGGGLTNNMGAPANVTSIAIRGAKIYATGLIIGAGGVAVRNVAMWDGKRWFDLDGGVWKTSGAYGLDMPFGLSLAIDDGGEVYLGGILSRAGGTSAMYLAHWNGTVWGSVDDPNAPRHGINGFTNAVAGTDDGKSVYVGGGFDLVGRDIAAQNVARFDGSSWHAMGLGLNGYVTSLASSGNELWAAGDFTGSGTASTGAPVIAARGIARWTGATWSGVGGGIDGRGRVVARAPDGKIWLGGEFENAGMTPATSLAVWSGDAWSAVGKGLGGDFPRVSAIAFHAGKVYVGGEFTKAGDVDAVNVAVWDGTTWSALGTGLDKSVTSLAVYDGKIIAGGSFVKSGATEVRHLASWDGTKWTELAGGLHPSDGSSTVAVQGLVAKGSDLYVGGIIDKAGAVTVSHVAHWNGTAWSAMNGGLNDLAEDLWIGPDSLWVAGTFSTAGGGRSVGVGRWWFPE